MLSLIPKCCLSTLKKKINLYESALLNYFFFVNRRLKATNTNVSLLVWLFFSKWISHFGTELLISSLISCQIRSPDKWHPHLSLLLLCYRFTSFRISIVWGYIDSSCWFALFIVDLLVCAEKLVYLFFCILFTTTWDGRCNLFLIKILWRPNYTPDK